MVLARNPEEQKWYYMSVYESCIENENKNDYKNYFSTNYNLTDNS